MVQQLADQYRGLVSGWNGWIVIRTIHHHARDLHVPPESDIALTEMGVLVNWPGVNPDGMFLPWTEVISMEQEHEDAAKEAREHATAEDGSAEGAGNGRVRRARVERANA